jgi:hypothetical protein
MFAALLVDCYRSGTLIFMVREWLVIATTSA